MISKMKNLKENYCVSDEEKEALGQAINLLNRPMECRDWCQLTMDAKNRVFIAAAIIDPDGQFSTIGEPYMLIIKAAEIIDKLSSYKPDEIKNDKENNKEDNNDDNVEHPQHYTSGGVECIDAMQITQGKEAVKSFCICNAFKYLWRHENKNGTEDIKKAIWYLKKYVELEEG